MSDKPTYDELVAKVAALEKEARALRSVEEALRESEYRFNRLHEASFGGIAIHDKGRILDANQGLAEMTGYPFGDLIGMDGLLLIAPDWRKFVVKKIMSGYEKPYDAVGLKKDGTRYFLEIQGKQIPYKQKIVRVTEFRDITRRKKVEEELRLGEEKYRNILESIIEGYYEVDLEGNYTFFNPAMVTMLGYEEDEMRQMNYRDFMDQENAAKVFKTFHMVFKTKVPTQAFDWKLIRKNGTECYIEASVALIRNSEGKAVGFRGLARDITEEKIREHQIRQAQKMESIGTLAGGIAHDFNNILSGMMGYTELLLMEPKTDMRTRDALNAILEAGLRARDLIDQILTFSRQTEQEKKPVQIQYIIHEALRLLRATIPSTIQFKEHIQKNTGSILADPSQIHQILMNLYSNASHAMREEGGVLHVSLSNVVMDEIAVKQHVGMTKGAYVKLSVSDTGHGMDAATRDRVFDPFFTTKDQGEGSGLGLSVVHGIVKSLGGTITLYSNPGEGTTFHIYFPRITDGTTQSSMAKDRLPRGSERLLIVDDERLFLETASEMLTRLGYEVTAFTDSREALIYFKSNAASLSLVITDQTMPHMAGDQFKIVQADIPVILCTGFSANLTRAKCEAMGIAALLQKPVLSHVLANTVREVLDRSI